MSEPSGQRELGCPFCRYETVVFEEGPHTCPECGNSEVRRLERKLEGHGVETHEGSVVLVDVEEASQMAEVFEMLGVVKT